MFYGIQNQTSPMPETIEKDILELTDAYESIRNEKPTRLILGSRSYELLQDHLMMGKHSPVSTFRGMKVTLRISDRADMIQVQ